MPDKPGWLPDIICIDMYEGNWVKYLKEIYRIFKRDLIEIPPSYEDKKVCILVDPKIDGKEFGFWHIISEGKVEGNRTPDLRRCERINWPKPIIINYNDPGILIWELSSKRKGHRDKRVCIWLEKFNYIIVLGRRNKYFLLITTYLTDRKHTRKKLRKQYNLYLKNIHKKADVAPEDDTSTPSTHGR